MSGAGFVALGDEVNDVLVAGREGQVVGKNGFDLRGRCEAAVAFIKELPALLCLFVFARLVAAALVPAVLDHVFDEIEAEAVCLQAVRVRLLQLVLDVSRAHPVEAEVL